MTPEQKQIAIAEFEGWENCHFIHYHGPLAVGTNKSLSADNHNFPSKSGALWCAPLPPYLTSRDAICGVVARLDDGQKVKFANYLYDIYLGFNEDVGFHRDEMLLSAKSVANMVTSTPAQLSDALLLTLGYEL